MAASLGTDPVVKMVVGQAKQISVSLVGAKSPIHHPSQFLWPSNYPQVVVTGNHPLPMLGANRMIPTPLAAQSVSSVADGNGSAPSMTTTTSGMIVLNKSTITEEDIEVPYGQNLRNTVIDDRDWVNGPDPGRPSDGEAESANEHPGIQSPFSALSRLSACLREVEADDEIGGENGTRTGEQLLRQDIIQACVRFIISLPEWDITGRRRCRA